MKTLRERLVRVRGLALPALLVSAVFASAESFPNSECLDCHEDPTLSKTVNGEEIPLEFQTNLFLGSVHGKLLCTDCHVGILGKIWVFDQGNNSFLLDKQA